MKTILQICAVALSTICIVGCSDGGKGETQLVYSGAGASFPAPVYNKWQYHYHRKTGTRINYQSLGSSAGISQLKADTIDFAACDKPLKKEELDAAGFIQFPVLIGGVVPIVNIPGVKPGEMCLSGAVLSEIFLGKIKNWNDTKLAELNPHMSLPDMPITVVHRSDGSGTTWIFTNYLSKISENWAQGPGNARDIKWPVGFGAQRNSGVANNVLQVRGSIGYVEYTYAAEANISAVSMINKNGRKVIPAEISFAAAAANADWDNASGFYMVLTDQPGEVSWPITGVTYILMHKQRKGKQSIGGLLEYFRWCYDNGDKMAHDMYYIAVPEVVVDKVKTNWKAELRMNR